ncbi:hypothetical protein BS50DRAFT_509234 [Corynespora cassiicola Philippines]|uniref:Uncharacterized protein n=1 Tax=Corynespora cassiicola Philippines TaxID=1448308 RepID=A0A2T2N0T7_CORCC|nr:hypothetical protein BS50DRAFT_509234 [Corynespora cassiicola Philippines]
MSVAALLSQLKGILVKTEQLQPKFGKVYPTDDQWETLTKLSLSLSEAARKVEDEIRMLRKSRTERAWRESKEHRLNAQSLRGDLFAKGRLKNSHIFRRNIVTIFEGPKDSKFDSEDLRIRKESTRKRCDLIRVLSPDGIISWAIAFAPTLWAGGSMASDVFTCLLHDIEPELVQPWPPKIRETLQLLREDEESLNNSPEYEEFLKGDQEKPNAEDDGASPRESDNTGSAEDPTKFLNPPKHAGTIPVERLEIEYRYSEAPITLIHRLGEPFASDIQSSKQWKWERALGGSTTDCLTVLSPKNQNQDISINILVGFEEGTQLLKNLQLKSR